MLKQKCQKKQTNKQQKPFMLKQFLDRKDKITEIILKFENKGDELLA